jgi:UDPglucose 6-dehydrogenase
VRLSVIGTGYLGATHAACLAELGHDVVGFDVDETKIALLERGESPFHEPDLPQLLRRGEASGHLRFTCEEREISEVDAHFICVGTPQSRDSYAVDLGAVAAATECLGRVLQPSSVVIGKSTVPVGTAANLRRRLEQAVGRQVAVAWNPEFLREGCAVEDSLRPERIVLGVEDDQTYERILDVYAPLAAAGIPIIRTDLATAELAKVSANTMLAARLSVVNVLAEVCAAAGGDIDGLTAVLGSDSRIGEQYLKPGVGYGGSCLPKDVRGLVAQANELGLADSAALLAQVDAVNVRRREHLVDAAVGSLGDDGHRVAVLGAAFKKDSDDIRDSPALAVAVELHRRGFEVAVYDPQAGGKVRHSLPELESSPSVAEACRHADLVMVLTDWDEFAEIDPMALQLVVRRTSVIDGRLLLDAEKWRAAGWMVHRAGWSRR